MVNGITVQVELPKMAGLMRPPTWKMPSCSIAATKSYVPVVEHLEESIVGKTGDGDRCHFESTLC